jgi:hypothetical protein
MRNPCRGRRSLNRTEDAVRWVGERDWSYSTKIPGMPSPPDGRILLVQLELTAGLATDKEVDQR